MTSEHFAGEFGRNIVGGSRNYENALSDLGLNYEVELRQMYYPTSNDTVSVVPNHVAAVRKDNDNVLGMVSPKYGLIQPRETFNVIQSLLELDDNLRVVSGGPLDGGKTAWAHVELPVSAQPVPGDLVSYLLQVHAGFAGTAAHSYNLLQKREACVNHSIVTHLRNAFKIRHTKHAAMRLDSMRADIQAAIDAAIEHVNVINNLAKVSVSDSAMNDFVKSLFPKETQKTARERVLNLAYTGKGQDISGVRGTAWAAYNAVTEYNEYWRGTEGRGQHSTQESRWQSVTLGGPADDLNQQALQYLSLLAA